MPMGALLCFVVESCVYIVLQEIDIGVADVGTATRLKRSMLTYQCIACFTHHLLDIMLPLRFTRFRSRPSNHYYMRWKIHNKTHWIFLESRTFSLAKLLWLRCLHQWMVFFYGLLNLKLVWHY